LPGICGWQAQKGIGLDDGLLGKSAVVVVAKEATTQTTDAANEIWRRRSPRGGGQYEGD